MGWEKYENGGGMEVGEEGEVLWMVDGEGLRGVVEKDEGEMMVGEIEGMGREGVLELEKEGMEVVGWW